MPMPVRLVALAALACFVLVAPALPGQTPVAPQDPPRTTAVPPAAAPQPPTSQEPTSQQEPRLEPLDATTATALDRLATRLEQQRRLREQATARGDAAEAARIDTEVRRLEWQFAGLAARMDVQEFEAPQPRQFELQQEVEQLVRPLVRALKDVTATPRQVDDLEARKEVLLQRRRIAEAAARAVERTRDALPAGSPGRDEAERELTQRWQPLLRAQRDELIVIEANLLRLKEGQQPLWTTLTTKLQLFVQDSGLSLLLALIVFLGVFFGLSSLFERVLRRRRGQGFSLRLLAVLSRIATVLLAVVAMLLVPYARNDWFLLAVGIVFLVGAGWIVIRLAPQFFEQIRLILNIGSVREGERLLVDGLPYRVSALRFYSRLENPDLQGAVLRVPIKTLVGQRSRPTDADEPWFPCTVGDVVLLSDGTVGPVRVQTPEVVVIEQLGTQRSYRTKEFLERSPRNLSRGFVLDAPILLHKQELLTAPDKALDALRTALRRGLADALPAEHLRSVDVQFQAIRLHGLEVVALVECDGRAAPRFTSLRRTVHRLLAAACRDHGITLAAPPPEAAD
jgi:hypothetical protein